MVTAVVAPLLLPVLLGRQWGEMAILEETRAVATAATAAGGTMVAALAAADTAGRTIQTVQMAAAVVVVGLPTKVAT